MDARQSHPRTVREEEPPASERLSLESRTSKRHRESLCWAGVQSHSVAAVTFAKEEPQHSPEPTPAAARYRCAHPAAGLLRSRVVRLARAQPPMRRDWGPDAACFQKLLAAAAQDWPAVSPVRKTSTLEQLAASGELG